VFWFIFRRLDSCTLDIIDNPLANIQKLVLVSQHFDHSGTSKRVAYYSHLLEIEAIFLATLINTSQPT
jgi:hypothetical protein